MSRILETINEIKKDIYGIGNFKNFLICFFLVPSFRLLLNYRIGKYFHLSKHKLFRLISIFYQNRQLTKRNCYISFKAKIGHNVKFAHPIGIVIGDGVVIGDSVIIWQNVTLGSHGKKETIPSYPVVEDGVKIYAGAIVIGNVTLHREAIIGANSVVNIDVPANKVAIGAPAHIIENKK